MRRAQGTDGRQRGVALAVVVWFIAGMSLLVAGIVLSARTDARLAQIHLGRAQAAAAGDGAIRLLLADVVDGRLGGGNRGLPQQRFRLGERWVAVAALPVEWMLDANAASAPLLANAFELAGAGRGDSAQALASAVVQWRSGLAGVPARQFKSIEDLLRVQGMNRASWDLIRDFVAVVPGAPGQGGADPRSTRLLQQLAAAAPSQRVARGDGVVPGSTTGGLGASGNYRVDAIVEIGDTRWLRRRWVSLGGSRGALPWRAVRTEPARIIARPGV